MFFAVYLCLYQQTPSKNKSLEKPVGFTGGPSQLTMYFAPKCENALKLIDIAVFTTDKLIFDSTTS